MLKRLLINRHILKANRLHDRDDPPISIQSSRGVERAHTVEIDGPCRIVYSPDKPLKCGATVWIETRSEVHVDA